jgi:3-oxoacyl-[acyl-carrier protein] reductase
MAGNGLMTGKVVAVTGGGGGIGSAICARMAEEGAHVVLVYNRSMAETQAVCDGLAGDNHLAVQASVEDSTALARLAEQIADRYGRLDVLVNNAGVTRFVAHENLDELSDELIDWIFRTNVRGAFACVRAMRDLLAAGDGGLVVNISSTAGLNGVGSNVAYCASKAALNNMTMSLARALAPAIRVIAVAPGLVEGKYAASFDPAWRAEHVARTPLKRLATGEDVAGAVLAAATLFPLTTGCVIPVEGGRLLA